MRAAGGRSAQQPDRAVTHLDREPLQRASPRGSLDRTRERLERALGTQHHPSATHVVERMVPRALEASLAGDAPLAERGKEMATAVGKRKRLARAHSHG